MIFDVANDAVSFVGCHEGGDAGTADGGRKEDQLFEPRKSLLSSSDRKLNQISSNSSVRSSSIKIRSAYSSAAGKLCPSAVVSTLLQEDELSASRYREHLQHSCSAAMSPEIAAAAVDVVSAAAAAVGLGFDEIPFGSNDDVRGGHLPYHEERQPPMSIAEEQLHGRIETFGAGYNCAAESLSASINAGYSVAELGQLRLGVYSEDDVGNGHMLGSSAHGRTPQPSRGQIGNEAMKASEQRGAYSTQRCFAVVGQSIRGELVGGTSDIESITSPDIDPLCQAPDFLAPSAANGNSALPKRVNINVGAFCAANSCGTMPPLSSLNVEDDRTLIHSGVVTVGVVGCASNNEDTFEFFECKNDTFSGDDRPCSSDCASERSGKAVTNGSGRVSRRGKSSQDGPFETLLSSSYAGPHADEGHVSSQHLFALQLGLCF